MEMRVSIMKEAEALDRYMKQGCLVLNLKAIRLT